MNDDDADRSTNAISGGSLAEESSMTEILLAPDGRIRVFGLSREVLEVLNKIQTADARVPCEWADSINKAENGEGDA